MNGWPMNDDITQLLEAFTCPIYGYPKDNSVNHVRSKMLKKMVWPGGGGE